MRAPKGAYKIFLITRTPKGDIDGILDWVIGNAVFKGNHDLMGKVEEACEIIYYARPWRCRGYSKYSWSNSGNSFIRVEMPFNSLMIEFFGGSNMEELIQCTFVHMKTQLGKP